MTFPSPFALRTTALVGGGNVPRTPFGPYGGLSCAGPIVWIQHSDNTPSKQ